MFLYYIKAVPVTYSLTSSGAQVSEDGSTVTITLNTTGVAAGTEVPYSISGISSADIVGGSLTGNFVVTGNKVAGTATLQLSAVADALTEGNETATIALNSGLASVSLVVSDTSRTPTYSLTRSAPSVNEGNTVTFTLMTTSVPDGTVIPYVLSGVSGADIVGGSLTGNFVVMTGVATADIQLVEDLLTEGNETLSLALRDIVGHSIVTVISDTSLTRTYSISCSAVSVNEGSQFTATLTTTGVANGTNVPYTITGITSDDIQGSSLTGNFVVNNNTASVTWTAAADNTTEGVETATISLDGGLGSVNVSIADTSTSGDPYQNNVAMLLHFDGANNGTVISDSTLNYTFTNRNVVTSTTQSKFGGTSGYFNGDAWLTSTYVTPVDFQGSNFTIEAWIYPTATDGSRTIFRTGLGQYANSYILFRISDNGKLRFQTHVDGNITSSTSVPANTWSHVAVTRQGNTTRLFLNGVLEGTASIGTISTPSGVQIGAYTNQPTDTTGNEQFAGYIDELRVTKGVARYTAAFTPVNSAFELTTINTKLLMHFDGTNNSTAFIDETGKTLNSSNAVINTTVKKFGTGAGYFNGSSYVSVPTQYNSDFHFGTGDFTIEFWYYATAESGSLVPLSHSSNSQSGESILFYGIGPNISLFLGTGASAYDIVSNYAFSTNATTNTWNHIALTRSGTTFRMFFNGALVHTLNRTASLGASTQPLLIGARYVNGLPNQFFNGYIDELRITKGIARYTAAFTPQNAPFTE